MPRLSASSVPKYRKHRASGQAVVTLGGRDHYLGPHGSKVSRLEYDRLVYEWLAAGRRIEQPAQSVTVAEVVAAYWAWAQKHYRRAGRPTGSAEAQKPALRLLREYYGRTPAAEFGPRKLKGLLETMIRKVDPRGERWSRRYINDLLGHIRRVFKFAASEQMIPVDVYQSLATVDGLRKWRTDARESESVLPVADDVLEATLPHLPEVVADMVMLQRACAARPGEICSMRPADVDRSSPTWVYRPREHKTSHHERDRVIPLGPQARAILEKYLARDAEEFCFKPSESEAKRRAERHARRVTPLNAGNKPGSKRTRNRRRPAGACYTNDSYRRAIHRACDKAFPAPERLDAGAAKEFRTAHRWSPNQIRHAAATEIRRAYGLEAAQVLLGHSSADVTQVYAERDLARALEVAELIG
jgi:integrase